MTLVLLVAGVAWHPAARGRVAAPPLLRRCGRSICCANLPESGTVGPDVSEAAADVKALLKEEQRVEDDRRADLMSALFAEPVAVHGDDGVEAFHPHLLEREELIGQIDSSTLLELDEAAGLWPANLEPSAERKPDTQDMLFVDQLSCIGCRWCACVARETFQMDEETGFGTAVVVQQGGDQADVIEEAIDVCPADCIQRCSRDELKTLERYRSMYFGDEMASHHARGGAMGGASRGGDGGGRFAAPHWRDPLTHTSWERGDRYVKTARLKMSGEDALLRQGGSKTPCVFSPEAARINSAKLRRPTTRHAPCEEA